MTPRQLISLAADRAVAQQQATQLDASLKGKDGVAYARLAAIIEREFAWVEGLIEAAQCVLDNPTHDDPDCCDTNLRAAAARNRLRKVLAAIPGGENE